MEGAAQPLARQRVQGTGTKYLARSSRLLPCSETTTGCLPLIGRSRLIAFAREGPVARMMPAEYGESKQRFTFAGKAAVNCNREEQRSAHAIHPTVACPFPNRGARVKLLLRANSPSPLR